ncbi:MULTISPECIES: ROK family protein [unclassified Rhizobium]|uniref:ROK family protein n=1 Tax=unclassified Rhizobium TaxID=2613769 RepID=UPI0016125A5C|nr:MULTISPECIES: ROK family protein [unclassified Rhizobium]MBB3289108.1 glucokinase [Rhizobium sp. BK252]MBB3403850.1 glucokinase [Rhizobium sp. BK289]MBB3416481.1 glucokinase [Rhizobium sp. BK284]MBB3484313.1 glucokinase [Rhizobium sp. BK347]
MTTKPDVVGVDIGGTKISAGYLERNGRHVEIGVEATTPYDGRANIDAVKRLLATPSVAAASKVGVSVATTFDIQGRLRDPHGWFGWTGANLIDLLSLDDKFVHVVADGEAGAIGERKLGASQSFKYPLYVTIGSGIAHCFIDGDRPLRGAQNAAYFSGYTVPGRCSSSTCNAPFVEKISSGKAIALEYFGDQAADTRIVFDRALAGEERASEVIEHAAWHLGTMIGNLMLVFDPDGVVIGGGLGSRQNQFRERIMAIAREQVTVAHTKAIPIVAAELGPSSCWVGAIFATIEASERLSAFPALGQRWGAA